MPCTTKYYWVVDEFGYFVADFDSREEMNEFIEASSEELTGHWGKN